MTLAEVLAFIQEEEAKKKLILVEELKTEESSYEAGYRKGIELKSIQFGGWCMKNLVRKGQGFLYNYELTSHPAKDLIEFYDDFIRETE